MNSLQWLQWLSSSLLGSASPLNTYTPNMSSRLLKHSSWKLLVLKWAMQLWSPILCKMKEKSSRLGWVSHLLDKLLRQYTMLIEAQKYWVEWIICSYWFRCSCWSTCNGGPLAKRICCTHCSDGCEEAWLIHIFCKNNQVAVGGFEWLYLSFH